MNDVRLLTVKSQLDRDLLKRLEVAEKVCHSFILLGDNRRTWDAVAEWNLVRKGNQEAIEVARGSL